MTEDEQLKTLLPTLPLRERKALELRFQGSTYKQIAAALRTSKYCAIKLVGAARARIDAQVKAEGEGDSGIKSGATGKL